MKTPPPGLLTLLGQLLSLSLSSSCRIPNRPAVAAGKLQRCWGTTVKFETTVHRSVPNVFLIWEFVRTCCWSQIE